jgi:hypothetical protein
MRTVDREALRRAMRMVAADPTPKQWLGGCPI